MCKTIVSIDQLLEVINSMAMGGVVIKVYNKEIAGLYEDIDIIRDPSTDTFIHETDCKLEPEDIANVHLESLEMRLERIGLVRPMGGDYAN